MKTMLSQGKVKFAFNHESARLTSLVAANKGNHVYVCDDWQPSYNPRHLPVIRHDVEYDVMQWEGQPPFCLGFIVVPER